jgi:hypothetical protein
MRTRSASDGRRVSTMTQAAILRCRRAVFLGGDLVLPIYVKWPRTFRDTKKDCARLDCRNDDRIRA